MLDCFASVGTLALQCHALKRHCISVEADEHVFSACLASKVHVPAELGHIMYFGPVHEELAQRQSRHLNQEMRPPRPPPHDPTPHPGATFPRSPSAPPASMWPIYSSTAPMGMPVFPHGGVGLPSTYPGPIPFVYPHPNRASIARPLFPPGTSTSGYASVRAPPVFQRPPQSHP